MNKTNNSTDKGQKRVELQRMSKSRGYKKTKPRYENFKGEPIE